MKTSSSERTAGCFTEKRLRRQRLVLLRTGKKTVSRSDLITLKFFCLSAKTGDLTPFRRFTKFVDEIEPVLEKCFMAPLIVANPYEAFLLMCLLTDWPLEAFSDVWELSYSPEE